MLRLLPDEDGDTEFTVHVYTMGGLGDDGRSTSSVVKMDFRYDTENEEWEIQGGQDCWIASVPMTTRRRRLGALVHKGNILWVSGRYERTIYTKSGEMFDPRLNQWANLVDSSCGFEVNALVPCSRGILKFGLCCSLINSLY